MKFSEFKNYNQEEIQIDKMNLELSQLEEINIMEKKCKQILHDYSLDDYFKNDKGSFKKIEEYLKLSEIDFNNKKILEFGSGNCKMSAIISKLYNVKSIDCLDLSETLSTEIAPRVINYLGGNLKDFKFIIGDMNKIDQLSNIYDVVICYSVVHHLQLPEYFFQKQLDKITDDKSIILCLEEAAIPIFTIPFSKVYDYRNEMYNYRCNGENENVYNIPKYKSFFKNKWNVKNLFPLNLKGMLKRLLIIFSFKGFAYNFVLTKK
tara:strand:- start:161 stop:949 length:789 start_codon:yes stop_codon:yes gene_type:complete